MMQEKQRVPRVKHRDESRLLRVAIQVIHSDFPNPDRLGCPGRDALRAIERRRLSFPEAEDVVDHIATCAACFDEYTSNRRRHRLHVVRAVLACSISLVLAIAVWWRVNPTLFSVRRTPAVSSANPTLAVTLDLRKRTVERSGQSHLPEGVAISHLRRALLALTIKLPIGVEDGVYSVQVRDRMDQTIVEAVGTAKWDGSAEVLTTTIDLRGLRGDDYLLAIGGNGSSWRKYPVRLE
jgi:hypothetical protein